MRSMLCRRLLAITFAVVLIGGNGVAEAAPRQPTGKWIVNFDDAQCLAQRDYGRPDDPLTLVLKQPSVGDVMQLAVIGRGDHKGDPQQLDATIRFDNAKPIRLYGIKWSQESNKRPLRKVLVPLKTIAAASARTLLFQFGDFREEFSLSSVAPLLQVMETCAADLRRIWDPPAAAGAEAAGKGMQPPRGANLQTPSLPGAGFDLRGLINAGDYPQQAIWQGQSGTVAVALLVDEAGKVQDCSVIETSGVAVLDSQSCAVIRSRARLSPPAGADGTPRKSTIVQRIRWQLGTGDPRRPRRPLRL